MFCQKCGQAVAEGAYFCPKCGSNVGAGTNPGFSPTAPVPANQQKTSGLAIASLICGILFPFFIPAILAIIFGHISLSQIKQSAGRLTGRGLAIAGLVLGYMEIALMPIMLIIAAIAIPNLLRAKMAANESSAMGSIRTLNTAEVAYVTEHPDRGYTCTLSDLREAGITDALATGSKSGYVFELLSCSAETPGGANPKFQVIAYPLKKGGTGQRAFCSDESLVIRYDRSGSGQGCLENGTEIGK
jgi:type II secretory pathway pseudopilin PulG